MAACPFYGTVLLNVPIVETEQIGTAGTDGRKIMINVQFMNSLAQNERGYVILHELLHIMLGHPFRRDGRDPQIYNVAADFIVNDLVDRINARYRLGLHPPLDGCYARIRSSDTTEELYSKIAELNSKKKQGERKVIVKDDLSRPNKGSEHAIDAPMDVLPGEAMPKEMQRLIQREMANIMRAAQNADPGMAMTGLFPREMLTLIQSKKLPWKRLLRDFMSEEVESEDSSYATPERKYIHMDLILPGPGPSRGTLGEIWAFVDSSGSVNDEQMRHFLTQLYRIVKEFQCTMNIAYWDTSVTDVYRNVVGERNVLKSTPKHSGGTDINCVFKWIQENRVKPEAMLILTDGFFGRLKPEYQSAKLRKKTIVVLSKGGLNNADVQQVGKVAELEEKRA